MYKRLLFTKFLIPRNCKYFNLVDTCARGVFLKGISKNWSEFIFYFILSGFRFFKEDN